MRGESSVRMGCWGGVEGEEEESSEWEEGLEIREEDEVGLEGEEEGDGGM